MIKRIIRFIFLRFLFTNVHEIFITLKIVPNSNLRWTVRPEDSIGDFTAVLFIILIIWLFIGPVCILCWCSICPDKFSFLEFIRESNPCLSIYLAFGDLQECPQHKSVFFLRIYLDQVRAYVSAVIVCSIPCFLLRKQFVAIRILPGCFPSFFAFFKEKQTNTQLNKPKRFPSDCATTDLAFLPFTVNLTLTCNTMSDK